MYLFARTRTCAPDRVAEASAYALDIAAKVTTITGREFSAWQVDYGAPLSTFTWTTTVESHADVGVAREKLEADPTYVEALQTAGDLFVGPAEDALSEIVAMAGDGGHGGSFASAVTAQCAQGKIAEAMAWGVDILNHATSVTGRDALFGRSMYGPWATLGWITMAHSLDEVEAASAALNADPEYITKIDAAGPLFRPDTGLAVLSRRLG